MSLHTIGMLQLVAVFFVVITLFGLEAKLDGLFRRLERLEERLGSSSDTGEATSRGRQSLRVERLARRRPEADEAPPRTSVMS